MNSQPHRGADSSHSDRASTTDVVVVGGGLAGLVAATTAARSGCSVVLLEARSGVGGRARTDEFGGAEFNLGPHALYRTGAGAEVLSDLGIEPKGSPPQGSQHVLDQAGLHLLPTNVRTLLRTSLLKGRDTVALARVLGSLDRIDPQSFAGQTVDEAISQMTSSKRVRSLLHGLVRLTSYGADHSVGCFEAAIGQLQLAVSDGVLYLDDGWQQLVSALVESAEAAGVRIVEGADVTSLERGSPGIGVASPSWSGTAASVVLAIPPAIADRLLKSNGALVAAAGPAVAAAVLDVVADIVPPRGFVLGLEHHTYASVNSPPTNMAPSGSATVCARYLVDGEGHGHDETRELLRAQRRVLGIADGNVVAERYMHRMVVANGQPLAANGGMSGRPSTVATDWPDVFLAGDWVGPEGLLADASLASGREAGQAASDTCNG